MDSKNIAIGVHIGGRGIMTAAVDLKTCNIIPDTLQEGRVDKTAGSRHILSLWAMQIKKVLRKVDNNQVIGVGFTLPGPFEYQAGIAQFQAAKYGSLKGFDISKELSKRIMSESELLFRYINDAKGYALGLHWRSGQKDSSKTVSVIIGEGFGSAFLDGARLVASGANVPKYGDVYHLPFKDGIADDYFSGRGILKVFADQNINLFTRAEALMRQAHKNPHWQGIFDQFGKDMAECLAPVLRKFEANKVSFGGYIGSQLKLFKSSFVSTLKEQGVIIEAYSPEEGDEAFIYGAAALFVDDYWKVTEPVLAEFL